MTNSENVIGMGVEDNPLLVQLDIGADEFSGDPAIQGQTDFGTQMEDMDAINRYMRTTKIVNNEAFPIKDSFLGWYDRLSYLSKSLDGDIYNEARTRMNKFNLANVTNEQQRENVVRVITTGVTTEEMQGKPKLPVLSTGEVGSKEIKKASNAGAASASASAASQPTATGTSGKPVLKVGSTGEAVKQWQKIVGVSPLTGYYGDFTANKTIAWKKANGLPATGAEAGIVNEAAWAKALGIGASPFAPPPTPSFAPSVPSAPPVSPGAFAPSPAPARPSTPKTVATKPAAKPAAPAAKTVAKRAKATAVQTASLFDITKWPGWAKGLAALTAAGGAIGFAFNQHKKLK